MKKIIIGIVIVSMLGMLGGCGNSESHDDIQTPAVENSDPVETANKEPVDDIILADDMTVTPKENAEFFIMRVNDDYNDIMTNSNWIYHGENGEYPQMEDGQIARVTADISIYSGGEDGYNGNYFIENLKEYEIIDYDYAQEFFDFPDANDSEFSYDIRILSYFHDDHKYLIVLNTDYIKVYDDGISMIQYRYDDYDSDLDGFREFLKAETNPVLADSFDEDSLLMILGKGFDNPFHCVLDHVDEDGNYVFHIYESVDNETEQHTATLDWITVDPNTGDATGFFGAEFNIRDYLSCQDDYANIEEYIDSIEQ